MHMMIMVLNDSTRLNEVLEAWTEAGIRGVTVLESTGLNRIFRRAKADPLYAGFSQIFGGGRVGHNTLFAVVDNIGVAETAVSATEKVLGSLKNPDTGIIFAVPVANAWGLPQPNE
ncbi:MAG: hypothetical protein GY943_33515 [Chloroflexi bacterium]|nr:hypothetical protein [Chloroflexota bacterium]